MTLPLEQQETLKQSTLTEPGADSENVAEKITLKVDESITEHGMAPTALPNSAISQGLHSEEDSVQSSNPNCGTKTDSPSSGSAHDPVLAALPVSNRKAFFYTILCCYLPVVLYLLFAFFVHPEDSKSQLVRFSPLFLTLPFAMLLPVQLQWRKHIVALTKALHIQTNGKFPISERQANWLGLGIGPCVLLPIYLGTKLQKGLCCDGLLPTLPPVVDIVLSIAMVALIIVGTTLPLIVSAAAYLKLFGAVNTSVKPVNIATVAPSPLLSSAIVSVSLLLPVMLLCWSCPPFNLLALPLQIGGWWLAFREIDTYANWVKTNRRNRS